MRLDAMADDTLIDDAALAFDAVSFIPPYNEFTGEPQATAPPFVPSYEKANARPPEDGVPPIDVRHFKTRLCVYLASGSCPHGARCFFAHSVRRPGVDELRPPSTHAAAEYKTRPCRYALSECPFAAAGRCQFAHGVDELRSPPATLASPERMLSARRFKTRLCKYFLAGHCPYAATNTCQFAHSNDELRAPLDGGNGAGPGVYPPAANAAAPAFSGGSATRRRRRRRRGRPPPGQAPPAAARANRITPPPAFQPLGPSRRRTTPRLCSSPLAQLAAPAAGSDAAAASAAASGAALRAALEQKRFTKLCKYFLAGHCPFEASGTCQFAHSARARKRSPPRPRAPYRPRLALRRVLDAYRPAAPGAAPPPGGAPTALYAAAPRSRHLVSPGPIVAPAPFTYQEWAAVPPGTQYVNRVSSDDNPAQDLRADPWTRHAALEARRGGAPHGGPRRIEPHSPTSPFSGAYNRPVDGVPFFADGPPLGGRAVGAPDWSFNGEAATSP
ncbi:hypothetical protein SO694_00035364 [Aureococcus anophagefferens]|uniref:C3H1-type domain-containing protein n=1 Tax=Aureococcus anophagefferens TaxID=44056 RepID=A0ABR1FKR6_AURAN